jgi:hypothetical protein
MTAIKQKRKLKARAMTTWNKYQKAMTALEQLNYNDDMVKEMLKILQLMKENPAIVYQDLYAIYKNKSK